jgi:hypothetical protein
VSIARDSPPGRRCPVRDARLDTGPVMTPPGGEWGAGPRASHSPGAGVTVAAIAAAAVLVPGGLAWLWGGLAAGALVACLCAVLVAGWIALQPRRALGARAPVALDSEVAPRLSNVVAGLSGDLGVPAPRLWMVAGEGANAVVGRRGGPAVGFTRPLLESYTRTELEAVAAHCLVRLGRVGLRREAVAAALGPLGGRLGPLVDAREDATVAAITRYPPALASAIRKAAPSSIGAPFLFVAPPPWHDDPEQRARAVADL